MRAPGSQADKAVGRNRDHNDNDADAQAAWGSLPETGQLRWELFLCADHKTLRITERITRLLCPSSEPGPRHPPQQAVETGAGRGTADHALGAGPVRTGGHPTPSPGHLRG